MPVTREYLQKHLRPLRDEALTGRAGMHHARRVAAVYDGLLSAYFLGAAALRADQPAAPRVALLALGGYGRGTLGLGSDLDLVVLTERSDDPALHTLAERFVQPLAAAGAGVGHAVRTADDLVAHAKVDLRALTALLDARCLAGDAALARDALAHIQRALLDPGPGPFILALAAEMSDRHKRHGEHPFHQEPDVMHGRGALRDLDIARWILRARHRVRDFTDALQRGALASDEHDTLVAARELYWRLRGHLHARTGRRCDRLTLDAQSACAAASILDPEAPARAPPHTSEGLLATVERHGRSVTGVLERILARCNTACSGEDPPCDPRSPHRRR